MGDPGSIPGLGRSPGEENGYPLLCSRLENSMDRGAWRATYSPWVTKRQTRLSVHAMKRDLLGLWFSGQCSFPGEQIAKAGLIGKHFVFALNQGQARPSSPDSADSTCTKETPFTWKIPTKAGKLDAHASRSLDQVWPKTHLVKRKGAFMCGDLRFSGEVERGRRAQNLRRGCDAVNPYTGQTGGAVVR